MEKLAGFTKEIFLGKEYKNPQELAGYLKMTADKLSIFLEKIRDDDANQTVIGLSRRKGAPENYTNEYLNVIDVLDSYIKKQQPQFVRIEEAYFSFRKSLRGTTLKEYPKKLVILAEEIERFGRN
jgi:hypothetical protein